MSKFKFKGLAVFLLLDDKKKMLIPIPVGKIIAPFMLLAKSRAT
jgi:hypothetical protein